MDEREIHLLDHFRDLRKCLIRAVWGVVIAMCGCFYFADDILAWLRKPMQAVFKDNSHFIVLVPHEYFFTEMKAALVAGLFLACPWVFYQLWLFIAPGLYKKEKKMAATFVSAAMACFVLGGYFGYTFVFPPMFDFFIGTLPPDIQGNYSVGMLFGFATNMLLAFGLVFETPVIVFLLVVLGLVGVDTLSRVRRYWIVGAFLIAAILTPTPDPFTQTMMAVPMVVLYEIGLIAARLFIKRSGQAEAAAEA
jgi:sec-independent protein translocase protein TatC